MADTKTSAEAAAVALTGSEIFPGVQSAADVKITVAQMASYASANRTSLFNAQIGTSYSIVSGDGTKEVTFANAAAIAATLPQAGTAGFNAGWFVDLKAIGVGALTVTPTTSTINGVTALVLTVGMWARVWSDGVNYQAIVLDASGILVNTQTGTSYTYLSGDRGKLITHANAAAIAGSLPQATGAFGAGWSIWLQNRGAGTLTITPTTSTIDGAVTLALTTGQGCLVASDGANYFTMRGIGGGGGGLTNFAESLSTAAPNDVRNAARLIPSTGTAVVDLVLSPKGNGAVQRQLADGTATGGNKRGAGATDWQSLRSLSSQVASGQGSFAAGESNEVSGVQSAALGTGNIVSSGLAGMAFGSAHTVSGYAAASVGGTESTVNSVRAIALGGRFLNSRSVDSLVMFGASATSSGKRQGELMNLSANTTDATVTSMSSDSSAAGAANQMILANTSMTTVTGVCSARHNVSGDAKGWSFSAVIKRGTSAAATALVGSPTVTVLGADTGAAAWTIALVANTTTGCLSINVTGEASKSLMWDASIMGAFAST
jgi:hypothetical protein